MCLSLLFTFVISLCNFFLFLGLIVASSSRVMSCNCGESKCSCSEKCLCFSELCQCTVCFSLKNTAPVKSEETYGLKSCISNAPTVSILETLNTGKSNSDQNKAEIMYSSRENLKSDLVSFESDKIRLEAEKECSSSVIYPNITLSDTEYETVLRKQDSAKVGRCYFKKENSLLKIKSDNRVDIKLSKYKRYFEYFSNKTTNSKRRRLKSSNKCRSQKSGFKVLSRKPKHSQSRKRQASMNENDKVQRENESNKKEIEEDEKDEQSKFNVFFNDVSSGYSDYDTDESKSTKTSTTSNHLSSLNIGGSFSEPENTGCGVSQTDPCSRCKRKRRMLSYKSLQNSEMSMGAARIPKFQEGPLISFRKQTDPMPSCKAEIQIKKDAIESSTTQGNCLNDTGNLGVYDFDEKESAISSSDGILNFRKRCVKIDNSGRLKINVYPIVSQPLNSGKSSQIDSAQNVDSGEMDNKVTRDNQNVSPLNASCSAETLNDCVVHKSSKRMRTKMSRKLKEKGRKTTKRKREERKRKIKKITKIKSEIKEEKE